MVSFKSDMRKTTKQDFWSYLVELNCCGCLVLFVLCCVVSG